VNLAAARIAIACRRVTGFGGTTTTVLQHARRLSAHGVEVHVFGQELDSARIRAAGAHPRRLRIWPWGDTRSAFARSFARAAGDRFDLVHGHGDLLAQDVLSLHNCVHATYEAVHGRPLPSDSTLGRLHEQQLRERRFQLLIANSRLMQEEVAGRFGVPREMIRVIYPGYDALRFRVDDRGRMRAPARASLGVGEDAVLVGLITSGDFVKRGVQPFLAALGRLSPAAQSSLQVIIAGKEHRMGPYRRMAAELGLGSRIQFMEPVAQVERLYHALDLYVHPAAYEEFGQSVQEALACGVPVLAGKPVGASELMPGDYRTWLLERPDLETLTGKLERMIQDVGLRERLAALGPPAVAGNTWDANFAATLACYDEIDTTTCGK
jgi:UDP-glucose:(heptosyl)LPS alpha-1,3-glucosyltransferase